MAKAGRPRKLTPIEERSIYGMKSEGASYAEIAYKHDISVKTVERIIKRIEQESEVKADEK